MILLAAVLAALAATAWCAVAAWLHGTFAPDPGIHRPIRRARQRRVQDHPHHHPADPPDVRRQVLAGPKERT